MTCSWCYYLHAHVPYIYPLIPFVSKYIPVKYEYIHTRPKKIPTDNSIISTRQYENHFVGHRTLCSVCIVSCICHSHITPAGTLCASTCSDYFTPMTDLLALFAISVHDDVLAASSVKSAIIRSRVWFSANLKIACPHMWRSMVPHNTFLLLFSRVSFFFLYEWTDIFKNAFKDKWTSVIRMLVSMILYPDESLQKVGFLIFFFLKLSIIRSIFHQASVDLIIYQYIYLFFHLVNFSSFCLYK